MSESPGAGPSRRQPTTANPSPRSASNEHGEVKATRKKAPPPPLHGIRPTASPASASEAITPLSASSSTKCRPKPLVLGTAAQELGQDEERSAQLELDGLGTARSNITITTEDSDSDSDGGVIDGRSDLSEEIDNLSLLRRDVQANLRERPLESPLSHTTSDVDVDVDVDEPSPSTALSSLVESDYVSLSPLNSSHLVIDIRPLGAYLASHLPGSLHLAIPSLLYKRYRRYNGQHQNQNQNRLISVEQLAGYITPQSRRPDFERALSSQHQPTEQPVVLVLLGQQGDEALRIYKAIMSDSSPWVADRVKILRGGWAAVQSDKAVLATLQTSTQSDTATAAEVNKAFPPLKSAPLRPAPLADPAPLPLSLPHKQSMPTLRSGLRRKGPALSIQTAQPQLHSPLPGAGAGGPPKLSLKLDRPTRSNTTGQFLDLRLNVPPPSEGGGGSGSVLAKTPSRSSFQSPSPTATFVSEPLQPAALPTARNAVAPFIVSTILPSFLYLGPEITSQAEIKALKDLGVKRILNVALECEDDQGLGLSDAFDKYTKIPMRDIVEETGVSGYMRETCDLLDDARLHSAPVYVHCKAGKSRSVAVVLAYLIHANAWTLKTAYAYVAERRKGISPNIGFVAELMQFEELELGIKQSSGVHGEVSQPQGQGRGDDVPEPTRGSLPPAWANDYGPSSSLDTRPPGPLPLSSGDGQPNGAVASSTDEKGRTVRDEREVMKNGQWVQQRRAPVDRMTLQPGRRASKAGLESLRSTGMTGINSISTESESEVGIGVGTDLDPDISTRARVTANVIPREGEGDRSSWS